MSRPGPIPRYLPEQPLPAYRHLPGQTVHPFRDLRGHSFGLSLRPDGPPLTLATWRENRLFLGGVDLFNHGYWWEAHEWWEALWRQPGTSPEVRLFLQALIQLAVGLVKNRQGSRRGLVLLLGHAREKLARLRGLGYDEFLGLHLPDLLADLEGLTSIPWPVDGPEDASRWPLLCPCD
ncbi:MAG: DUF309 domain-containing protein [Candidatus Latescibacterota bacterium]